MMIKPCDIRIIVACEESQAISNEFRKYGFDAYSCDLKECSGGHPEYHFQEDIFSVLEREKPFDLMIGHPPCTYLSNAGSRWLYAGNSLNKERYYKGLKGKEFFMKLLNYDIKHIAIENPIPTTIYDLPEPSQIIEPYMFGDPYTKRTCLWLKKLPLLIPTKIVTPIGPYLPSGSYTKTHDPSKKGACKRGKDAIERSKTFPGIAKAIAKQWGDYILKEKNGHNIFSKFFN